MEWLRIYKDLISNLFTFFSLHLFINSFSICKEKEKQLPYKLLFLCFYILFSFIPEIPFYTFINLLSNFAYVFIIVQGSALTRLLSFIKYELYLYISIIIIAILQAVFTMDATIYTSNDTYAKYSDSITAFLVYVILSVYIIIRNLSAFPKGRIYKRYFIAVMGSMTALLVLCSMLLGSNIINQEDILPFMFSLLLLVTILCITVYRKIVNVLEENALARIEAQTNALQQDYYTHVENNLKTLSLLRHDFKNHMIILEGYAKQQDTDKLLAYIQSIQATLVPTKLIQTPSPLLSSLLNAKNEDCKLKGITLDFSQSFSQLVMDDFHIVTIMSNLLDNAITAAAKCPDSTIILRMIQLDSYLEIDCTNPHCEKLLPKGNFFLTTKEPEKEIHGLGITSMRRAVNSLHGTLSIDYTSDTFHVSITVPNYT